MDRLFRRRRFHVKTQKSNISSANQESTVAAAWNDDGPYLNRRDDISESTDGGLLDLDPWLDRGPIRRIPSNQQMKSDGTLTEHRFSLRWTNNPPPEATRAQAEAEAAVAMEQLEQQQQQQQEQQQQQQQHHHHHHHRRLRNTSDSSNRSRHKQRKQNVQHDDDDDAPSSTRMKIPKKPPMSIEPRMQNIPSIEVPHGEHFTLNDQAQSKHDEGKKKTNNGMTTVSSGRTKKRNTK
jgi:hypothetical protein